MKGDTLTFKQKQFARAYVKNRGNGTQAAIDVYDVKKRASAKAISHQNLDRPLIQAEIRRILDESGMSLNDVGLKIKEAIDKGLSSGKATVSDSLKGLDMVLKLHNAYPANKSIKLSYSRNEQTASKDMNQVLEELQKLNKLASSLLDQAKE